MDKDEVISQLNDLIETSRDGEKEFRAAAEHTEACELKAVFENGARRCIEGASELQSVVQRLGGSPSDGGSVSGAMRRGWTEIKEALSGMDDVAVLDELERGEDCAINAYREALNETLPPHVLSILERQYRGVLENHQKVRDLRDRYRSAA